MLPKAWSFIYEVVFVLVPSRDVIVGPLNERILHAIVTGLGKGLECICGNKDLINLVIYSECGN